MTDSNWLLQIFYVPARQNKGQTESLRQPQLPPLKIMIKNDNNQVELSACYQESTSSDSGVGKCTSSISVCLLLSVI